MPTASVPPVLWPVLARLGSTADAGVVTATDSGVDAGRDPGAGAEIADCAVVDGAAVVGVVGVDDGAARTTIAPCIAA
jgi:hypothetical protein